MTLRPGWRLPIASALLYTLAFNLTSTPVLVTVVGLAALHSVAWKITDVRPASDAPSISIAYPLAAVVAVLLVFQLILRPGIAFY